MADLIYNPLLKKSFQEVSDTGSIEAEIDDLRQKKVTKFFSASDSIENDEIAQYQGEDDVAHGLNFGLFYVQSGTEITLPEGTQYFENIDTVNLFGYDVRPGNFYLVENITPAAGSGFTSYRGLQYESARDYLFVNKQWPQIGESVWDVVNQVVITVTDVNADLDITLSNGVIIQSSSSASSQPFNVMYNFVDINNNNYSVVRLSGLGAWLFVHYSLEGGIFSIENFFAVRWSGLLTSLLPIVITNKVFTQTDTQPRTPGVTVVDGVLQISLPVEFSGNITVHGTEVVVTTEQIQSEKDFVKLRYNNPLALASGETSGISVNNYDGNGTDCILAVDDQGWARVGDSSGTLQKLATIEDNPTDGAFATYNATDKELQTTNDGSALTVTFTPDTTSPFKNIASGDNLNKICAKISRIVNLDYTLNTEVANASTSISAVIVGNIVIINGSFNLKTYYNGAIICTFSQRLVSMSIVAYYQGTTAILGILWNNEYGCTLRAYGSPTIEVDYTFGSCTALYL